MKYFAAFSLILLMTGCGGAQPETDPAINIPAGEVTPEEDVSDVNVPNLTAGIDLANQSACRANMHAIAASVVMYQAQNGLLPATLAEVGVPAICPDAGAYRYTVDGQSWTLDCPANPTHGSIANGVSNW
ncbi:MAG: hypothetical protein K8S62_08980 [Candidatus Sabulitectum sp.]|nr:hypothetical protein [Candidatus Sabulitectum sp.]